MVYSINGTIYSEEEIAQTIDTIQYGALVTTRQINLMKLLGIHPSNQNKLETTKALIESKLEKFKCEERENGK